MDGTTIVLHGTLKSDGTLELDEKPNLPPGRVQVAIKTETPPAPAAQGWWDVLQKIWAEQAARGYRGRTGEEIDAEINEMRNEWEEHQLALERIQEEAARAREQRDR
jgi:hypothetical protein